MRPALVRVVNCFWDTSPASAEFIVVSNTGGKTGVYIGWGISGSGSVDTADESSVGVRQGTNLST